MSTGQSSTRAVIRSVRETGSESSWRIFVQRYWRVVHQYAISSGLPASAADDLTQDVMAELLGIIPSLDLDQRAGSFRSLLRTIVRRRVVDWLRKDGRSRQRESVYATQNNASGTGDDAWDRAWRVAMLRDAVDNVRLSVGPVVYQAFELTVVAGVPAREAARMLGVSTDSIYAARSRVSRQIRENFRGLEKEELE